MKAVIVTGGKQYTVAEGDVIYVEKLGVEAENTVTFDQVLAVVDGENSKFGKPMVAGARSLRTARARRLWSSSTVPRRTPSPSGATASRTPRWKSPRLPCKP